MNPLHRIEQEVLAQGREWTRLKKGQFLVLTTRRPGPNVLRAAKVNKTKNGPEWHLVNTHSFLAEAFATAGFRDRRKQYLTG